MVGRASIVWEARKGKKSRKCDVWVRRDIRSADMGEVMSAREGK